MAVNLCHCAIGPLVYCLILPLFLAIVLLSDFAIVLGHCFIVWFCHCSWPWSYCLIWPLFFTIVLLSDSEFIYINEQRLAIVLEGLDEQPQWGLEACWASSPRDVFFFSFPSFILLISICLQATGRLCVCQHQHQRLCPLILANPKWKRRAQATVSSFGA